MILENKTVWLIMSKDRKFIAKGTVRNRELIEVDDKSDKKRFLTYSSKKKAESAFKTNGFYSQHLLEGFSYDIDISTLLEAVECKMTLEI